MNIKTSRIGLIGATGKAGSAILTELLQKNIKVVALVRESIRLKITGNGNLSVIHGDAADPAKLEEFASVADIIIDASNARKGEQPITKTVTAHLIRILEKTQKRLFLLAGKTVKSKDDLFSLSTLIQRRMLSMLFPAVVKAKAESLALLKKSAISWTMVRCPLIVDNDCRRYRVSLEKCSGKSVSKISVAAFIIDEIGNEQYLRQAPFVCN